MNEASSPYCVIGVIPWVSPEVAGSGHKTRADRASRTQSPIGPRGEHKMAVLHLVLLFALISYCLLKWLKYRGIPDNFPPGPPAVPILGVLPFIQVQHLLLL